MHLIQLLCMFPHVDLPINFRNPKFEKFDSRRDPVAHIKRHGIKHKGD